MRALYLVTIFFHLLASASGWTATRLISSVLNTALRSTAAGVNQPEPISSPRAKLTIRQKQFWEDVETGISDIKRAYSCDSDLPRIEAFQEVAQWKTTAPQPQAELHDPCEEYIPGLTAKPYWESESDRSNFPWIDELEERSGVIIKEFFEVMERENKERQEKLEKERQLKAMYDIPSDSRDSSLFSSDSAWQNDVMGAGWSAVRLQRLGEWNAENCARFPNTYEVIRSLDIPLAVRGVCFARQTPGSGVFPHSDGRNFILTSHLGIKIPEGPGVSMKVGSETRQWLEGKVLTLDTSFVHSTKNDSPEDRYVLIIDFWHPELTEIERKCLEFVYDLRNKFERGDIPVRPLRKTYEDDPGKTEGKGLAGLWQAFTTKNK